MYAVESIMRTFNKTLSGTVDLYTVDHHGTERSNYFECQAAQALSVGSTK